MEIEIQVLSQWPEPVCKKRRDSPFKSDWSSTLGLLETEMQKLSARNAVLKTMHNSKDLRLDGRLRGDAGTPASPGVILVFEKFERVDEAGHSVFNEMRFPCDTFTEWRHTSARSRWRSRLCVRWTDTA